MIVIRSLWYRVFAKENNLDTGGTTNMLNHISVCLISLLDDNSEDNAESEITAFMRERADPDTDSLVWWKDNSDKYSHSPISRNSIQAHF
jgi:hypothetical protein